MMKILALIAYLIIFLILESCIEYSEKMKLNDNGSGEITFAIGINREILSLGFGRDEFKNFNEDSIKKNFSNKEGVEFINSRTFVKNNNRWIEVKLKFDSIEKLRLLNDSTQNGMIGFISLTKDQEGNLSYTRKIFPYNRQNEQEENGILALMFSQYKWTYELKLPSNIISTNAHEIDNNTNTAKWTFSLSSLASEKQMVVVFEHKKEYYLIYLFIAGFILASFVAVYFIMTKKKKQKDVKQN